MGRDRFYGMPLPEGLASQVNERLTDSGCADLVRAHLQVNFGYFGAIDKTLSGFVILDDRGDDYTLLDLRDGQQIWWQDHDDRSLWLQFDSLAARAEALRVHAERLREDRDADFDAVAATLAPGAPRGTRKVSTPELLRRYQWLVWALAQPMRQDGRIVQPHHELTGNAIGWFRECWPDVATHEAALAAELGELRGDPHLAIYWLLHTTLLGEVDSRHQVLDAIGDDPIELVRAFVEAFGTLEASGDLPLVPDFRERRALLITKALPHARPQRAARHLLALEVSPSSRPIERALLLKSSVERGDLSGEAVRAALARIDQRNVGTELLRTLFGAPSEAPLHAEQLARLVCSDPEPGPWWSASAALHGVHAQVEDLPLLEAATRRLLRHDPGQSELLEVALQVARRKGEPTGPWEARLALSRQVDPLVAALRTHRGDGLRDLLQGHPAEVSRLAALGLLRRAEAGGLHPEVRLWATTTAMEEDAPESLEALAQSLPSLSWTALQQAGTHAAAVIGADAAHPLVPVLLSLLDRPRPTGIAEEMQHDQLLEMVLGALRAVAHQPPVFEPLLERVAHGGAARKVCELLSVQDDGVEQRLSPGQLVRFARGLIVGAIEHPDIHARNAADRALRTLSRPEVEDLVVETLGDLSARASDPGFLPLPLDHRQDTLKSTLAIVDSLYGLLGARKTPTAKAALRARLGVEQDRIWSLGDALRTVFDAGLEAEVLAQLEQGQNPRVAAGWAYTLREHVQRQEPRLRLARCIAQWRPSAHQGALHYALLLGLEVALDVHDVQLVRDLHAATLAMREPPQHPGAASDRARWASPLEDAAFARRLAEALSGEAEEATHRLRRSLRAALDAGGPPPELSLKDLSALAGREVARCVFRDADSGETWFRGNDGRLHAFLGTGLDEARFVWVEVGLDGIAAHLEDDATIDARGLWWTADGNEVREVLRLGSRVLLYEGTANGALQRDLLVFPTRERAVEAFAQLSTHVPERWKPADPHEKDGQPVIRTFYVPLPDGGYTSQRWPLAIRNGALSGQELEVSGTADPTVAHREQEAAWLRANGTLVTIEA